MTTKTDCIKLLQEQTGLEFSDARDIVDEFLARKEEILADKRIANADAKLNEYMLSMVEEAKVAAAIEKKHMAINRIKRGQIRERISGVRSVSDLKERLLSITVGSHSRDIDGARVSAAGRGDAIRANITGNAIREMEKVEGFGWGKLRNDSQFRHNVVREVITPGSSGDQVAREVAKVISRYTEHIRQRLNRAGAVIRKLEGWLPQTHDAGKMVKAGRERWIEDVIRLIDVGKSFGDVTENEARKILDRVFDSITLGRTRGESPAQGIALPRNIAKKMGEKRVLHFADADAWIKYNQVYGQGDAIDAFFHYIDRASRKLGVMEVLGPNPENMLINALVDVEREIRGSDIDDAVKTEMVGFLRNQDPSRREGVVGRALSVILGETVTPENYTMAKAFGVARAWISMSKLGGATLSAFADVLTKVAGYMHRGENVFTAYHRAMTDFFSGMSKQAKRDVAHSLGVMIDGITGSLLHRFDSTIPGMTGRMMDQFFKWSGLTGWTEAHKAGYAMAFSNDIARFAGKWPKHLMEIFKYHGFSEKEIGLFRYMTSKVEGREFFFPELAYSIPDAELRKVYGRKSLDRVRAELHDRAAAMIIDETRYAVIEPDARTQLVMTAGTRPGTWRGEAIRFIMQFKSFPIAYAQRIIGSRRWRQAGLNRDLRGASVFIASSLLFGYAAMTMKDIAKGREPRIPKTPKQWINVMFAAAMQSGSAGLYGDFLFSQYSRFGQSTLESAAGPGFGALNDFAKLIQQARSGKIPDQDAFYLFLNNTPFINMWYSRAALDYLIFDSMREMFSPGSLRRQEKRIKEEYGQGVLYSRPRHHLHVFD